MIKQAIKKILISKGKNISNIFFDKEKFQVFFNMIRPIHGGYSLIRAGSLNDGGYLIPDDLNGIKYCFSPGVNDNSTFEDFLCQNYNIECYMCDNSVESPSINNNRFHFIKKHLNTKSDNLNIKLDEWIENNLFDNEMILQMDIEGSEYDIILNAEKETLNKFRIIVIEFHSFEQIFTYGGFKLLNNTFEKLLQNHSIIHIHPNNIIDTFNYKGYEIPTGLEMTFLRNDRIKNRTFIKNFPNKLDSPSNHQLFNFPLPKCFYEKNN